MAKPQKAQRDKDNRAKAKAKKTKKSELRVHMHIQATFNNTLVYFADPAGNILGWNSAGTQGFKGAKKSTPYAAQKASEAVSQVVKENYNAREVIIFVKGPGPGSEAAARAAGNYFKVLSIANVTSTPHNGCRESKERRV